MPSYMFKSLPALISKSLNISHFKNAYCVPFVSRYVHSATLARALGSKWQITSAHNRGKRYKENRSTKFQ